jgi:signal transduction histidine kinase
VAEPSRSSLESRIAVLQREAVRLRELTRGLIAARDDERRRIARDLHDNLSQQLALLAIGLQELGQHLPAASDALAGSVNQLWRRTVEISTGVHDLGQRLHPSKLEALGLVITMRGHCRDASRPGLRIHFSDRAVPGAIPPDVALCLYRTLEESLANVIHHSAAAEAHVTLEGADGELILRIVDTGRGFEAGGSNQPPGLGLISMSERLHGAGGTLTVVSTAGRGTTVEARVPDGSAAVQGTP